MTDAALDPTDIVGQQEALRRRQEQDRQQERLAAADWVWLMGSKRGRRIVYRLLARAGVSRLSFSTNAMTMAFNEGRRNEGLALLDTLQTHCLELYMRMIKEHSDG